MIGVCSLAVLGMSRRARRLSFGGCSWGSENRLVDRVPLSPPGSNLLTVLIRFSKYRVQLKEHTSSRRFRSGLGPG